MAYDPQNWANGEAGATPLSAERLNKMETGISDAHEAVDSIDLDSKVNSSAVDSIVVITQAAYNALATPRSARILYAVVG